MNAEDYAVNIFKNKPHGFFNKKSNLFKLIVSYLKKITELRKKNRELKAVAANQMKIISILAHDVRGPLASIKSVFELKETELLDAEDSAALVDHIKTQLGSTMEMVDDIVNWGQMNLQPDELIFEDVDVHALVQRIFGASLLKSIEKNNMMINNIPKGTIINSDHRAVEFILRNLIGNANKFTENGSISVDLHSEDGKNILCVTDTGVGMTTEKADELLYAESHSSTLGTNMEKGNGLGFMLVKEFVNNLGGSITIDSAVNAGTCFRISL
jgi:signal transduction histidine kinase